MLSSLDYEGPQKLKCRAHSEYEAAEKRYLCSSARLRKQDYGVTVNRPMLLMREGLVLTSRSGTEPCTEDACTVPHSGCVCGAGAAEAYTIPSAYTLAPLVPIPSAPAYTP